MTLREMACQGRQKVLLWRQKKAPGRGHPSRQGPLKVTP